MLKRQILLSVAEAMEQRKFPYTDGSDVICTIAFETV